MSRWDTIIPKLPRALRSAKILDTLDAIDAQFASDGTNGHWSLQWHYAGGQLRFCKIEAPSVTISLDADTS